LEVKLSFNDQARSGLQDQLAGRYIPQVAATGGVFVLVWMQAPRLSPTYRPLWATFAAAQRGLNRLADDEKAKRGRTADVRVAFIDASLPTVAEPKRKSRRRLKTKKPAAKKAPSRKKRSDKRSSPKERTHAARSPAKRQRASRTRSINQKRTKRARHPKLRR
jgi:hypothetical protein